MAFTIYKSPWYLLIVKGVGKLSDDPTNFPPYQEKLKTIINKAYLKPCQNRFVPKMPEKTHANRKKNFQNPE